MFNFYHTLFGRSEQQAILTLNENDKPLVNDILICLNAAFPHSSNTFIEKSTTSNSPSISSKCILYFYKKESWGPVFRDINKLWTETHLKINQLKNSQLKNSQLQQDAFKECIEVVKWTTHWFELLENFDLNNFLTVIAAQRIREIYRFPTSYQNSYTNLFFQINKNLIEKLAKNVKLLEKIKNAITVLQNKKDSDPRQILKLKLQSQRAEEHINAIKTRIAKLDSHHTDSKNTPDYKKAIEIWKKLLVQTNKSQIDLASKTFQELTRFHDPKYFSVLKNHPTCKKISEFIFHKWKELTLFIHIPITKLCSENKILLRCSPKATESEVENLFNLDCLGAIIIEAKNIEENPVSDLVDLKDQSILVRQKIKLIGIATSKFAEIEDHIPSSIRFNLCPENENTEQVDSTMDSSECTFTDSSSQSSQIDVTEPMKFIIDPAAEHVKKLVNIAIEHHNKELSK